MALKSTKRTFKTTIKNLDPVIEDFRTHFEDKGYKVTTEETADGAFLSLTNANLFKTVSGLKTGLNISLSLYDDSLEARMDVGIFGKQAVPGLIAMLVFWPILVTQIIGLVQQNKLDTETYDVIEKSLEEHQPKLEEYEEYCPYCGEGVEKGVKFCPHCGQTINPEVTCPDCGAQVKEGTKFCPNCGHKF
ncbi:MAG: zinc ribbon domain-containing protein [Bacilli bacterium]|nr:zinc ribbon domain-containing protein [Bacilli bacterium]